MEEVETKVQCEKRKEISRLHKLSVDIAQKVIQQHPSTWETKLKNHEPYQLIVEKIKDLRNDITRKA